MYYPPNDPRGFEEPGNYYYNPDLGGRPFGGRYDFTPISPKAFKQLAIAGIVLFFVCLFL